MSEKTRRKYLVEYTAAARQLELAGIAIDVIEKMHGATPLRIIKTLQHQMQRQLVRMDAAAAKLGAPYGA